MLTIEKIELFKKWKWRQVIIFYGHYFDNNKAKREFDFLKDNFTLIKSKM